ncbi:MAG: DUF3098 domain-containing protein [Alistipes sp.]|nr:DUF3098 domain-containing protein [Alistipes sp.]
MASKPEQKKSAPRNKALEENEARMPLTRYNYKLMLIGFAVIVLGFVLMTGGRSSDPNVFNYDMFSFRRITLAPILVLAGFAFEIYAIMARDKRSGITPDED